MVKSYYVFVFNRRAGLGSENITKVRSREKYNNYFGSTTLLTMNYGTAQITFSFS